MSRVSVGSISDSVAYRHAAANPRANDSTATGQVAATLFDVFLAVSRVSGFDLRCDETGSSLECAASAQPLRNAHHFDQRVEGERK